MYWTVNIKEAEDDSGNNCIQLGLKADKNGEVVCWVTEEHESLENWKQEVLELKKELDDVLEQGERDWENSREIKSDEQDPGLGSSPEEVWEQMQEFENEQEMSDYFNQLSEKLRKKTAEYILTQVSMFKGNAPYFAQNYDSQSNKLV